jgi:hypothetical protein
MANKTQEARTRRTAARDRRRSSEAEPAEEVDRAADETGPASSQSNGTLTAAAAKVVGTAVAAALIGALGGTVKAVLERRGTDDGPQGPEKEGRDGDVDASAEADSAESSPRDDEDDGAEPEAQAEEPEAQAEEPEAQAEEPKALEDEQSEPDERMEERPRNDAEDESPKRAHGVSGSEAAEIAAQARSLLEGLLGLEAERVSGLERVDGGWSVMLEVVEVPRIPESTDVLATYELVLDSDRNLVSVTRRRSYRRSQVDEAS